MRTTMTVAVLVMLALWLGYWQGHTHGYRQGVETERSAWLGTLQIDPTGQMTFTNPHGVVQPDSFGIHVDNPPDARQLPGK